MPLVLIPPGEFDMGSTTEQVAWVLDEVRKKSDKYLFERVPTESPRHRVKITNSFYLAIYHVTQAEYENVMGVNPSAFAAKQMDSSVFRPPFSPVVAKDRLECSKRVTGKDTSRHPVDTVSWNDAIEFCRRLSAMPGERAAKRGYRLPTEAEWEYTCRAGTTTQWYCGDEETGLVDVAWFGTNAGGVTHPVGEKHPNAWGLYDMQGSVYQWCSDWFDMEYYKQSPLSNPTGPSAGADRVMRGGFCRFSALYCRSAYRNHHQSATRAPDFGFRVVADLVREDGTGVTEQSTIPGSQTAKKTTVAAVPFDLRGQRGQPEAVRHETGQNTHMLPDIGLRNADSIPVGEVRRYPLRPGANAIAVVPGGQSFLATGWEGKVVWYRLVDGEILLQAQKGTHNYGIAVSPDGRRAVW
jgi:formylglycine-generating enzyme required for sulfatase activity